jgi:hypothetical protein
MKKLIAIAFVASSLVAGSIALAKEPAQNVSAKKHPNLAAAQKDIAAADAKLDAAQKANEYDMEGHAAKAKELLVQAAAEIKQAAEAANENKK